MHDFLLRLESVPECPGDGWEQILESDVWVYELPSYDDICLGVFDILSKIEGELLQAARLFLHVNMSAEETTQVLFKPACLNQLATYGVNLEIACI